MLASDAISTYQPSFSSILGNAKAMTPAKIDSASKDFESMFISQMVENMFTDSIGDSAFGSQESSDIYKGMMTQEYGKIITQAGGIGIASYIKKELIKQQEAKEAKGEKYGKYSTTTTATAA